MTKSRRARIETLPRSRQRISGVTRERIQPSARIRHPPRTTEPAQATAPTTVTAPAPASASKTAPAATTAPASKTAPAAATAPASKTASAPTTAPTTAPATTPAPTAAPTPGNPKPRAFVYHVREEMVRPRRLELPRAINPQRPQRCASTNSATAAHCSARWLLHHDRPKSRIFTGPRKMR